MSCDIVFHQRIFWKLFSLTTIDWKVALRFEFDLPVCFADGSSGLYVHQTVVNDLKQLKINHTNTWVNIQVNRGENESMHMNIYHTSEIGCTIAANTKDKRACMNDKGEGMKWKRTEKESRERNIFFFLVLFSMKTRMFLVGYLWSLMFFFHFDWGSSRIMWNVKNHTYILCILIFTQ